MTGMSGDMLPQSALFESPTTGHAASQLKSPSTRFPQYDHHYIDVNLRELGSQIGLEYLRHWLSCNSQMFHQTWEQSTSWN